MLRVAIVDHAATVATETTVAATADPAVTVATVVPAMTADPANKQIKIL